MPASTSRTPWSTFSGVMRLTRPSSSSSPKSPQVEPSGRWAHRFAMLVSFSIGRLRFGIPGRQATPSRPLRVDLDHSCTDRLVYHFGTPSREKSGRRRLRMIDNDFVVSGDGHVLEPTD